MKIANEYQLSPLTGIMKNKVISKDGPDMRTLATAVGLGFISNEEFEVLKALKEKRDIELSSKKLEETLKRLHAKHLVEKIE